MFERHWRKWGTGALQRVVLETPSPIFPPHGLIDIPCHHCKAPLGTGRMLIKYHKWYHLSPCFAQAHPERAEADRVARRGIKTSCPRWADADDYETE